MLQEAIAKITEIAGVLQQSVNKYAMAVKEIDGRAFKLADRDKAIDDKELLLIKREEAIKPIENVVKYHDEAMALKDEANKLFAKVTSEKNAFNVSMTAKQDQINALTRDTGILKAKAEKETVMIQKEWDALNKEKVEYKEKILDKIKNGIR